MGSVMLTPPELEDEGQAMVDNMIEVNLGTKEDLRPTFISVHLSLEE